MPYVNVYDILIIQNLSLLCLLLPLLMSWSSQLFKLEDVAMGIWIEEFKKNGQEVNYMNNDRFYSAGCESNYILAHYQNPRLLVMG